MSNRMRRRVFKATEMTPEHELDCRHMYSACPKLEDTETGSWHWRVVSSYAHWRELR